MAQPGREDVQDKKEGLSVGPLPHQSPDAIAAAFGLTNEQCSVTFEKQALQGVASAVQKAAERGPDPFRGEKAVVQGSTAYRPEEEDAAPTDPTKRDWTEADFMREFRKWALKNGKETAVVEGKAVTGDSIPFSRLEAHQRDFLLRASEGVAYYHPSDFANSIGFRQKLPADAFFFSKVKAFVAVMFHVKRKGNRTFYLVPIARWVEEEKGERRSLTEERAGEIGFACTL